MSRAQWAAAALTVALLCTGVGLLRGSAGAEPAAASVTDALPSRALGLSGHRRLVRGLEQSGAHGPGVHGPGAHGPGADRRTVSAPPMRAARPLRLRIPSLGVDLPVARGPQDGEGGAGWDTDGPAPGSAGTAVVTGDGLPLAGLRRGRIIEIPRADHRTAVFTVERVSPHAVTAPAGDTGLARLRLVSGETSVLARLTGPRRTG